MAKRKATEQPEQVRHGADTELEITEFDLVAGPPELWNDPDDEGPSADVYRDLDLFVASLERYHPHWICLGPDACGREHPGVRPGTVCTGGTVKINASNRAFRMRGYRGC